MKKYFIVLAVVLGFVACKEESKSISAITTNKEATVSYKPFGEEIIADDAIGAKSMAKHYNTMKVGDSVNSKMIAKVNSVCQVKGCWMKLDLENGEQVMVKFKDYGFFMPKNIVDQDVIVNGKAYVNEVSVDELRHYAEDAGKSAEEIAKITMPEKTFSFEADGVLLIEE